MESEFKTFLINIKSRTLEMTHPHISNIIYSFSFIFAFKTDDFQIINGTDVQPELIILDKCSVSTTEYLIICFNKQITIISKKDIHFINSFFKKNKESKVYILAEDENEIFKTNIHNKISKNEFYSFTTMFELKNRKSFQFQHIYSKKVF